MNAVLFLQTPVTYGRRWSRAPAVEMGADPMAYEWLRLGVRAALEGNREDARYYFVQAVRTDLDFARAWLYLGGVADDPALTLSCVQKVLQLAPGEPQARAGLIWARNKLGLIQPALPIWPPVPARPSALAIGTNGSAHPAVARTPVPVPPPTGNRTLLWGGLPAPTLPSPVAPAPGPPALRPAPPPPALPAPPPAVTAALRAPAPESDDEEIDEHGHDGSARLLRRGVRAAVQGDRPRARYFFLKAIAADDGNTRAWLYFGGMADDAATTLACMERVLRAEPGNREARAGVDWAVQKLGL